MIKTGAYYRNLHIDLYQVVQATRAMSEHAVKLEAYKTKTNITGVLSYTREATKYLLPLLFVTRTVYS